MGKRRLLLHAGPHKTGTTTLQYRLLNAHDHLAQHGFSYPDTGIVQFAHHGIKAFLAGDRAAAGNVTEDALKSMSGEADVILSSEDFVYLPNEALERLLNIFADRFAVFPVIFLRNPVHLWPSHWRTLVNRGRQETLLDYVGACVGLNRLINPGTHHALAIARRFASIFGREQLRLVCYDCMMAENIDIFDFFLTRVAGIPAPPPPPARIALNRSPAPEKTELIRCMNEQYWDATGASPDTLIAPKVLRQAGQIDLLDGYAEFASAFRQYAETLILDPEGEVFRFRETALLRNFGDIILNVAGPDNIFPTSPVNRLRFGAKYWAARYGMREFVASAMERFDVLPR